MMKWGIYISLFLLFIGSFSEKAYGQTISTRNKDEYISVHSARTKKTADSLFNLGSKYQDTQKYKLSLILFQESLDLYQLIGDQKRIGDCFNYMAISYYYQGNSSKTVPFLKKGAETFRRIGYKKGLAATLNNIGTIYNSQDNYTKALDYYRQAGSIFVEIDERENSAIANQNVGLIYSKGKDYLNAMKYFNQSYIVYKKLHSQKRISQVLNSIGEIHMQEGKYKKAFNDLNQALLIADKERDKELQIQVLSSLGNLFYEQSDYKKALPFFKLCLNYSNKIGYSQYQSEAMIAIGNIMDRLGEPENAIAKCQNGLILARKLKALSVQKSGCDCLYQSYKALGNTQQALYYYEQANKFDDSLNLTETSNKIMGMEFQKRQLVDSLDHVNKEHLTQLKHQAEVRQQEKQRNIIIITLGFILLIAAGLWNRLNYTRKSRTALRVEKDRSEALLLNILPEEIAEELKQKGSVSARDYSLVSILFTDFKSFTQTAEKMTPQSLVEEINVCFRAFDLITEKYQIEKIKTIGDAYMAAGGIPHADENSLRNIVLTGLEMQAFMAQRFTENQNVGRPAFEMRLGIHAGPIVAGIVGVKKFQYDVWGDTVNTASRMESNSLVGKVNISDTLYQLVKHEDCFRFEYRGHVHAKGKGEMAMYFVEKSSVPEVVTYEPAN